MADHGSWSTRRGLGVLLGGGSTAGLSDGDLVARLADPGLADGAFEALVGRHGGMVRSVCGQVLRHEHDADDAAQAVFLVLARRAGSIREPDLLAAWLHGVALRTARLARRRRRLVVVGPVEVEGSVEPPDRHLLRVEAAAVLHEEIGRLPEPQRRAVVLCHLQGLTHEEAASRLGVPIGTVGVRLLRARDRLRARLTRRGFAPSASLFPLVLTQPAPVLRAAAALAFLRGVTTTGEVPAGAASLAMGVLRTMNPLSLKFASALLGLGLIATGAWSMAPGPVQVAAPVRPQPQPQEPAIDPALAEFRRVYRLDPGQVIKRIPPPFAPWRAVEVEGRYPFLKENREQRGTLTTLIYRDRDGTLIDPSMVFGAPTDPGRWLVYLLGSVAGSPEQDVAGAADLLKTPIQGDWVVSATATPEQLVTAFEVILRTECKLPIRLTLQTTERDVIVARGRWQPLPLIIGDESIQLYGASLTLKEGGGGTGDLAKFFEWVGTFVEPHCHIISEVENPPRAEFSWHLNFRSPMSTQTTREDRGDTIVLRHVAEQTGLTFTTERRPLRKLVVERSE